MDEYSQIFSILTSKNKNVCTLTSLGLFFFFFFFAGFKGNKKLLLLSIAFISYLSFNRL